MKLYLIRHGQTTGDVEDRYGGDYDDHLTELGINQSKALAEKLRGKGVQLIFHSSRIRAFETAKVVGDELNIGLQVVSDLRERNHYGVLTGLVKSDAVFNFPEEVEKLKRDRLHHGVVGSEDYISFKRRVLNAFDGVLGGDYETVVLITHGGVIGTIVRELLKLGECKDLDDCAILELESRDGRVSLVKSSGMEIESVKLNVVSTKFSFASESVNPSYDVSDVVMLGVACDLTASYKKGAWFGPSAIFATSCQLEYEVPGFFVPLSDFVKVHNFGIVECPNSVDVSGKLVDFSFEQVEKFMSDMVLETERIASKVFNDNKFLMLFGGDHSVPNGVWNAIERSFRDVVVLHFDAHLDLRDSYEGHKFSHASILRRAREKNFRVIQVGPRDHISGEEADYIRANSFADDIFFCATQPKEFYSSPLIDKRVVRNLVFDGELSDVQVSKIVSEVCKHKFLWVTIDVDGLDASDVPGTGTPLPLGLSRKGLRNVIYRVLLAAKEKGVRILGFDINEVAPQMKTSDKYSPQNTVSTLNEMDATLLAFNMLFWSFLDRFNNKSS